MSYSIYKQNDDVKAYVTEFVCDSEADVANLPTDKQRVFPGSTAVITATSEVYMLNASYRWVKL